MCLAHDAFVNSAKSLKQDHDCQIREDVLLGYSAIQYVDSVREKGDVIGTA